MERNTYGFGAACCSSYPQDMAAPKTVQAQVVDEFGEPVENAHVWIETLNIGATSDANGMFYLEDVPGNAELLFSFQGLVTRYNASEISNQVVINTITTDKEVVIIATKQNLWGWGLLVAAVIGVAWASGKKNEPRKVAA